MGIFITLLDCQYWATFPNVPTGPPKFMHGSMQADYKAFTNVRHLSLLVVHDAHPTFANSSFLPIHTHGRHTTFYKRWSRSCIPFRPYPRRSQLGRAPHRCQGGGVEAGTTGGHRLGVFVARQLQRCMLPIKTLSDSSSVDCQGDFNTLVPFKAMHPRTR